MAYKIIPMGEFSLESKAQLIAGMVLLAIKVEKQKLLPIKTKNKYRLAQIAKKQ